MTPQLISKHPQVGTNIFTVMSGLAAEVGAVNLGQGFPDFECDPVLVNAVNQAMQEGRNQYPPMPGVLPLREAVSQKIEKLYEHHYDAQSEITVTAGATQALLTIMLAVVHPGDEVIVLEPCYDCYIPNVEMAGGVVVRVPLTPGTFKPDFDKIQAAITSKTRAILINSPHNPSGMVWRHEEMLQLQEILAPTQIVLISDEVYEHITFDGEAHSSLMAHPELFARSFVVSSFGKTLHATGWKIGFCAAPEALMAEFRKIHQFVCYCIATPLQLAIADFLEHHPDHWQQLSAFYQAKRDLFCGQLQGSRFRFMPTRGSYFQLLEYSQITNMDDLAYAQALTRDIGVASIPVSVFCEQPLHGRYLRFCFAKNDNTLIEAADRLCQL
mgnify:CR=1 FL=1